MRLRTFRTNTVLVAAFALLAASNLYAAIDMFLAFPDSQIAGESKDVAHRNEIDVLAWSWGLSSQAGQGAGGRGTQVCVQDISITKYVDSSTPPLIIKGVMGQNLGRAVLVIRKTGSSPLEYLVLTMHNVTVKSFSTGGSGGEDRLTENITLHFDRVVGEYVQQNPNGSAGTKTSFDVQATRCQ